MSNQKRFEIPKVCQLICIKEWLAMLKRHSNVHVDDKEKKFANYNNNYLKKTSGQNEF